MSQFQSATGPMPMKFIAMIRTPTMTNNMGAPSRGYRAGDVNRPVRDPLS